MHEHISPLLGEHPRIVNIFLGPVTVHYREVSLYYDFSVLWVGGVSSIQVSFGLLEFFNFAKPPSSDVIPKNGILRRTNAIFRPVTFLVAFRIVLVAFGVVFGGAAYWAVGNSCLRVASPLAKPTSTQSQ